MIRSMRWGIRLAFLVAAVSSPRASPAAECVGLPEPNLRIERLQANKATEHIVMPEQLASLANTQQGPAPHPLIVIAYELDGHFLVEHRLIAAPGGGYCDAPETIVLSFGAINRNVFLDSAAAREGCVRLALLAHEGEHNRAFNVVLSSFLQQHGEELAAAIGQLQRKLSPTESEARTSFEQGANEVLARLSREFKQEAIGRIRETIDTAPRLTSLRNSCDGRVDQLEKIVREVGKRSSI